MFCFAVARKRIGTSMISKNTTIRISRKMKTYMDIIKLTKQYEAKPIFDGICYNCGQLLHGNTGKGFKKTAPLNATTEKIFKMYQYDTPPENMCKSTRGLILSCAKCKNNAAMCSGFDVGDAETLSYKRPQELLNVVNYRDKQLLSLCALESFFDRPSDSTCNTIAHIQGITELSRKSKIQLTGMLGNIVYRDENNNYMNNCHIAFLPVDVTNALQWLVEHNFLYQRLLCNAVRADDNMASVFPVAQEQQQLMMGKETFALIINADPEKELAILPQINRDEHYIGTCVGFNEQSIDEVHLISSSNRHIEAMIWPTLFPYGYGSFDNTIRNFSIPTYARMRLLNYDDRWRRCTEYPFFLYDQIVRSACMYGAQLLSINAMKDETKNLNATDAIKIHKSRRAGAEPSRYQYLGDHIPKQVTGSKAYWYAKYLDLLTITEELGIYKTFISLRVVGLIIKYFKVYQLISSHLHSMIGGQNCSD